jgi:hypothetical protein
MEKMVLNLADYFLRPNLIYFLKLFPYKIDISRNFVKKKKINLEKFLFLHKKREKKLFFGHHK